MREFEKLVKKLRYCSKPGNCNLQCPRFSFAEDCLGKLTTDAADAIEELLAAVPHWISVEERLPEKGVQVLCFCRANIYCVMRWDGIDWYENPTHVYMSGFVTHWMPLPAPPKEGDE